MAEVCQECGSKIHFGECRFCEFKRDFLRFPLESHLKSAGVPSRSAKNTVHLYQEGKILSEDRFNETFEKGLFLTGRAGIGKTALAIAIMLYHMEQYATNKERFDKSKSFWFLTSIDLLDLIRSSYNNKESSSEVIGKIKRVDLLIIDDFGVEKVTDWALSILYSIVNYRYEEYKQTIFTSNLKLKDISRNFNDERIERRIAETCQIIEMK